LPATVQQEINAKQDQSSETLNKLINQQKLIILNIKLISLANSLNERLGKGESDAITLVATVSKPIANIFLSNL
jgi:predicted nucleic acid-binding protein